MSFKIFDNYHVHNPNSVFALIHNKKVLVVNKKAKYFGYSD